MSNSKEVEYREIFSRQNGYSRAIRKIDITAPDLKGEQFSSVCEVVTIQFQDSDSDSDSDSQTKSLGKRDEKLRLDLFSKRTLYRSEPKEALQLCFEKEVDFFNILLPDLRAFCREKLGSESLISSIVPKCYFANETLVVLENLVKLGFAVLDKSSGHTVDQATKIMNLLAQFHAVSYAMIQQLGEKEFRRKYDFAVKSHSWKTVDGVNVPWVTGVVESLTRILKKNPTEGSEKVLHYLDNFKQDNGYERLCRDFDVDTSLDKRCGIVVNHGDSWNPNFMFKTAAKGNESSGNQYGDCLLVDFQTVHLGSPVMDLHFYIFLAVQPAIRYCQWKSLLKIYYDCFCGHVTSLGGHVEFSIQDLRLDYRQKSESGMLFALYMTYGLDSLAEIGDDKEELGAVPDDLVSALTASADKVTGERGTRVAQAIVQEFDEYVKMTTGRD